MQDVTASDRDGSQFEHQNAPGGGVRSPRDAREQFDHQKTDAPSSGNNALENNSDRQDRVTNLDPNEEGKVTGSLRDEGRDQLSPPRSHPSQDAQNQVPAPHTVSIKCPTGE